MFNWTFPLLFRYTISSKITSSWVICSNLNYNNYSDINIDDLDDFKIEDIKLKNDETPILINPVETIKNKIYYDFK